MTCSVDHRNWAETAVFKLVKYSKSTARPELSADSQPCPPAAPLQWSHFTQSGLSLVVETQHLDSESQTTHQIGTRHQQIILKIVWDNNPGSKNASELLPGFTDRPGVFLLEKVNLTQVQERFGHSRLAGESALKAYSVDSVVGIRYATGQSAHSFIFNRMQIKLQAPGDPIRLIAIIEAICPCKISSKSRSSNKSAKNTSSQLSTNTTIPALDHPSSQPSIDTDIHMMDSQTFSSSQAESFQPSWKNFSQLPINTPQSASQPSIEADINMMDSQAFCPTEPSQNPNKNFPLRPPQMNLSAGTQSSQPPMESERHSQGSYSRSGQPIANSDPSLGPLPTPTHPDSLTRKSPPLENPHLPDKVGGIAELSDQVLMAYLREACMEPGFDRLVHRIRTLARTNHCPDSLPQ
ncbi:hypothetical protein VP01_924g6 [Puccinia sorghi]|uniref:Uncharacterized protein n=1 Tax=Puccinia sorghi TaxID=27349 RepID=A0A0L6U777_9BASI|nr:hypothetical protein VP01_924g6 [Puccinia sorghi]